MYYWRLAPLEFLIRNQLPLPEEMTLGHLFTHSSRRLTMEIAERKGLDYQAIVGEIERGMEHHYLNDVAKKPGVDRFLKALGDGGTRMCVSTAAPRALCTKALSRFDLLRHFDFVTDTYEVELHKGQPEHFCKVAERFGADVRDCWVFEDSLYAMKGAKAAGARVCAIEEATAIRDREEIREIADWYVADYRELF